MFAQPLPRSPADDKGPHVQFVLSALGYGLTVVSDLFPLEDHIPKLSPLFLQRKFPLGCLVWVAFCFRG